MVRPDNEDREQRILDAAANLFMHYGYDKTTIDDIAREAGISKGAIYLHFKGKDALFESLLVREMMSYQHKWLSLLDADPQGGTIGGMYKTVLYALNSTPFVAAMFRQDNRILGSYLQKPDNLFRNQKQSPRYEFVKLMQEAGAMRSDVDPKVVAHIMNMLAYGLVAMDDIIAPEMIPPTDELIEGIAQIMDRALTPADGGNSEAGKAIVRQIAEAGQKAFEAARALTQA
jgi:TetR/AcrR family acrAB operon transcriptional repressor